MYSSLNVFYMYSPRTRSGSFVSDLNEVRAHDGRNQCSDLKGNMSNYYDFRDLRNSQVAPMVRGRYQRF